MAKKRIPSLRGTPPSGRTGSKPRRAANAPQGSGRQPTRQSSSKPRKPKVTQAKSRPTGRKASAKGKPTISEWRKLIEQAAKDTGKSKGSRKSKSVSRKSRASGSKGRSSSRKTGDSGRHKKATRGKPDKRTKGYKEKEKWRKYGHLIRLTRLRSRIWKLAEPGEFRSYADTLELAKCMLDKNEGKIPRSNIDLLALMAECLDEVGILGSEPEPDMPDPDLVVIGEWDFYELDDLMMMLPPDFRYDIVSDLSIVHRFRKSDYVYADTFKEYVEYVNRKVAEGVLDKYHPIAIEWRHDEELNEWYLWVYELEPSGYTTDAAPLGIPRRDGSTSQAPIVSNEEREELEEIKEESKTIHEERQDLNKLLELLITEKAGLVNEYKMYMQAGDKESMLSVAAEAAEIRQSIINTRRQITYLKKGRKAKKTEVKKSSKKKKK